jgi:Spy/CpxP family protein refolding chaperone
MRAAVEAETFDEAVVRELAVMEGQAMAELSVIRARTEATIYELLTPEQRAKLAELGQQRRPAP